MSQVNYHKEKMQTQNKSKQTNEKKEQLKQGENASDKSAAGFGFASDWLEKRQGSIDQGYSGVKQNQSNPRKVSTLS